MIRCYMRHHPQPATTDSQPSLSLPEVSACLKREFFLLTVPKCLLKEGFVGVSLYYIGSLLYNIKDTEVTFVVIWAI